MSSWVNRHFTVDNVLRMPFTDVVKRTATFAPSDPTLNALDSSRPEFPLSALSNLTDNLTNPF